MSYMKCYGQYVANDPCAPFCSKPDGSGCDYAGGMGLTGSPYSVTYSDQGALTGNTDTRTYVPTIDPYQSQVPPSQQKPFSGESDHEFLSFADNSMPRDAFASANGLGLASGAGTAESVEQDGKTTTLTAVPRYSSADFFSEGEMNGVIPSKKRARGRRRLGEGFQIDVLRGVDGSKGRQNYDQPTTGEEAFPKKPNLFQRLSEGDWKQKDKEKLYRVLGFGAVGALLAKRPLIGFVAGVGAFTLGRAVMGKEAAWWK